MDTITGRLSLKKGFSRAREITNLIFKYIEKG